MRTEAGKMPESLVFPIRNGLGVSNDRFGLKWIPRLHLLFLYNHICLLRHIQGIGIFLKFGLPVKLKNGSPNNPL